LKQEPDEGGESSFPSFLAKSTTKTLENKVNEAEGVGRDRTKEKENINSFLLTKQIIPLVSELGLFTLSLGSDGLSRCLVTRERNERG